MKGLNPEQILTAAIEAGVVPQWLDAGQALLAPGVVHALMQPFWRGERRLVEMARELSCRHAIPSTSEADLLAAIAREAAQSEDPRILTQALAAIFTHDHARAARLLRQSAAGVTPVFPELLSLISGEPAHRETVLQLGGRILNDFSTASPSAQLGIDLMVGALGRQGSAGAEILWLRSDSPKCMENILTVLGGIYHPEVSKAFTQLLQKIEQAYGSYTLRWSALRGGLLCGDPGACRAVGDFLRNPKNSITGTVSGRDLGKFDLSEILRLTDMGYLLAADVLHIIFFRQRTADWQALHLILKRCTLRDLAVITTWTPPARWEIERFLQNEDLEVLLQQIMDNERKARPARDPEAALVELLSVAHPVWQRTLVNRLATSFSGVDLLKRLYADKLS